MKRQQVSLDHTGHFSRLFLDYIAADKTLHSFYRYTPSISSFDQALRDISTHRFNRKLLVDVIVRQYRQAGCDPPAAGCQLLLEENTFTVCTGHQLCLFTGPLYFLYKIISAINLAEALKKKHPACHFVPVYWMVSEDHDFEEVNHVNLFGKKIEWKNRQGGALGKYATEGISELVEELKAVFGNSKHADELMDLFRQAYTNHPDFSSATRYLVNALFGEYGLVIIDPNDPGLKQEFTAIMEQDLFENASFTKVSQTITALEKSGFRPQVNPREINLFYINNNQRNRIEYRNDLFNVIDTGIRFTKEQMKQELQSHPDRFSPNVVTRPLYQQRILPNLAYIGGPAEIAYWLEYKEMFSHYGVFFPVLMPRNFVMLADGAVAERLHKLGLGLQDAFLPLHEMAEKFVRSISGEKVSLHTEKEKLEKLYADIAAKAGLVDPTLVSAAEAEKQKHLKEIDNLEKKMLRAFKQRNETAVSQLEKIKHKLFPGGELQERHDNFIPFYLKQGRGFLEELRVALDPFDFRFVILSE